MAIGAVHAILTNKRILIKKAEDQRSMEIPLSAGPSLSFGSTSIRLPKERRRIMSIVGRLLAFISILLGISWFLYKYIYPFTQTEGAIGKVVGLVSLVLLLFLLFFAITAIGIIYLVLFDKNERGATNLIFKVNEIEPDLEFAYCNRDSTNPYGPVYNPEEIFQNRLALAVLKYGKPNPMASSVNTLETRIQASTPAPRGNRLLTTAPAMIPGTNLAECPHCAKPVALNADRCTDWSGVVAFGLKKCPNCGTRPRQTRATAQTLAAATRLSRCAGGSHAAPSAARASRNSAPAARTTATRIRGTKKPGSSPKSFSTSPLFSSCSI